MDALLHRISIVQRRIEAQNKQDIATQQTSTTAPAQGQSQVSGEQHKVEEQRRVLERKDKDRQKQLAAQRKSEPAPVAQPVSKAGCKMQDLVLVGLAVGASLAGQGGCIEGGVQEIAHGHACALSMAGHLCEAASCHHGMWNKPRCISQGG